MSEKIFCGSAKKIDTKHGEITKIRLSIEDLNKIINYMHDEGKNTIDIDIKEKKQLVFDKPTHYLQIDNWKPNFIMDNEYR